MIASERRAELRRLIGNPSPNDVGHVELDRYYGSALELWAGRVGYHVRTDTLGGGLVASTGEYPLPQDCLEVVFVEWNAQALTANSTFVWENKEGVSWRTKTADSLTEYAVLGRKLCLNPGPTAAAITTDGALTLRYLASPDHGQQGAITGLSDSDERFIAMLAADEWYSLHPLDEVAVASHQRLQALIQARWQDSIRRHKQPITTHQPRFRVWSPRRGAAR